MRQRRTHSLLKIALLASVAAVGLTACGSDNDYKVNEPPPMPPPPPPPPPPPTPPPPPSTVDPATSFGTGFGGAFATGQFGEPIDPDSITITPVTLTEDPLDVPDP